MQFLKLTQLPAVVKTLTTAATLTAFTVGAFVVTSAPESSDSVSGVPVAPHQPGASRGSSAPGASSASDGAFPDMSDAATEPLYNPFDPDAGPAPESSSTSTSSSDATDQDGTENSRPQDDQRSSQVLGGTVADDQDLTTGRDWTDYVTANPLAQPIRTPNNQPTSQPTNRPKPTPSQTSKPGPVQTPPESSCRGQMVVANYNIKSGVAYGKANLPTIAAHLRAWSPDVVLLQEVSRNLARGGNIDQAAHLAGQLGYHYAFGANLRFGGAKAYGTAILSRYPIVASENTALPNRPGGEQRGLLHAVLDVNGRELSAYVTHLQHAPAWEPLRIEQAQTVAGILAGDPRPKVIGGDFNSHPGSAPMRVITGSGVSDTWPAVGDGNGATVPAPHPNGRIDYLLHEDLTPVSAHVDPGVASDHLPILATYRIGSCS